MNLILKLTGKDFKIAITKMCQQIDTNSLEIKKEKKSRGKCKSFEEQNGNYGTNKYNSRNLNSNWMCSVTEWR